MNGHDLLHMREALRLAQHGWGRVQPNPLVGAVVVREGSVVGRGWHAEYGGPHAEVVALREAGERARGATLYVTLEPCTHHGKTPPCTDAILAAGIARVVVAAADPTREAAGGTAILRRNGIEVETGVEEAKARHLNRAFYHVHEVATPFVTLKLAVSLDGRISAHAGAPTRLSGADALAEVHRLRAGFDAILVGRGTVVADDPLLTVRGDVVPRIAPARVVLDSQARLPASLRMLHDGSGARVIVVVSERADEDRVAALQRAGADVLCVPAADGGVDLGRALHALHEGGISAILCEGGGCLAAALLEQDRVQRVVLFVTARFLGAEAVPAFPLRMPLQGRFTVHECRVLGNDAMIVAERV